MTAADSRNLLERESERSLVVWNKTKSVRKPNGMCIVLDMEEQFVMCETVTEFEAPFRLYSWFKRLKYGIFYACSHICLHKRICRTLHWKSRFRGVHVCLKPDRSVYEACTSATFILHCLTLTHTFLFVLKYYIATAGIWMEISIMNHILFINVIQICSWNWTLIGVAFRTSSLICFVPQFS